MGKLKATADAKGVKLIMINCEPGKDAASCKRFLETNNASELLHYQAKDSISFTKYFPFHVVCKDGKMAMVGGYDMSARKWKDWESIAGLK